MRPVSSSGSTASDLPQGVLRDVMEVTYHDDINEIDGFELTVNNWDDAARCCKYIGSETADQLSEQRRRPPRCSHCSILAARAPNSRSASQRLVPGTSLRPPQSMVRATFTIDGPELSRKRAAGSDGARIQHSAAALRTKKYTYAWSTWTSRKRRAPSRSTSTTCATAASRALVVGHRSWNVVTNSQAASAKPSSNMSRRRTSTTSTSCCSSPTARATCSRRTRTRSSSISARARFARRPTISSDGARG